MSKPDGRVNVPEESMLSRGERSRSAGPGMLVAQSGDRGFSKAALWTWQGKTEGGNIRDVNGSSSH
jgi:thiamine monophosphate kinase